MSDYSDGQDQAALPPQDTIKIHRRVKDVKGSGKTDTATGRYIPVGGGSRTRLPISDDTRISRYPGNLGVDASLSSKIDSMAALYSQLDSRTKQALGADFPESVGRPDLAELTPTEERVEAADTGDLAEAAPPEELLEAGFVEETGDAEPAEEPPRRQFFPKVDDLVI